MELRLRRCAVFGSGVMGAGIAGLLASTGHEVLLFDRASPGTDRSAIAAASIAAMPDHRHLWHPSHATHLTACNTDDDMTRLHDIDWVIEVIPENLELKHALFKAIALYAKPDCWISSNTSTLPLHELLMGLPAPRHAYFFISHFFNPPRSLPLLEYVIPFVMEAEAAQAWEGYFTTRLGRDVVRCPDAPGFIANRIGGFFMMMALHKAIAYGLTVERVDQLLGAPIGLPKTGLCGLFDLIGIDLMPHIAEAITERLPPSDPFHAYRLLPAPVLSMLEKGLKGRKSGGGFYRKTSNGMETLNLHTLTYEAIPPLEPSTLSLATLHSSDTSDARFIREVLGETIAYALAIHADIAFSPADVDWSMTQGYQWREGPFGWLRHIIDAKAQGAYNLPSISHDTIPSINTSRDQGPWVRTLSSYQPSVIEKTRCGSLYDLGNRVACLSLATKMHSLSLPVFEFLDSALTYTQSHGYRALLIGNDDPHFSAGADISLFSDAIPNKAWNEVEQLIHRGQSTMRALWNSRIPIISLVRGAALGGGCEILLHSHAAVCHSNATIGLVESSIGLVPGWGGCVQMIRRALQHPQPISQLAALYTQIVNGVKSTSYDEALSYDYMAPQHAQVMHYHGLFPTAVAMIENVTPSPCPTNVTFPTGDPLATIEKGALPEQKKIVAEALAPLFQNYAGTTVAIERLYAHEARIFLTLIRHPESQALIMKAKGSRRL